MRHFGYLETGPEDSETLYSKEAIEEAIKQVQKFGGLQTTGQLDNDTMKVTNDDSSILSVFTCCYECVF